MKDKTVERVFNVMDSKNPFYFLHLKNPIIIPSIIIPSVIECHLNIKQPQEISFKSRIYFNKCSHWWIMQYVFYFIQNVTWKKV